MNITKQYTKEKSKITSERSSLIEEILQEINCERVGTIYKATTPKVLGIKLSHIPTKDLYYLKSEAYSYQRRNGSFSKYIFGSIKVREE